MAKTMYDMEEVKRLCRKIFKAIDKQTTKQVKQYFKDGQKEDFEDFRERACAESLESICPEMEELRKLIGA